MVVSLYGKCKRRQSKDERRGNKVAGSNGQFAIDNKQKSLSTYREIEKLRKFPN
jgi:hypothetical protein